LKEVLVANGYTVLEGKTGYPNLIEALDKYVLEKPESRVAVAFIEKSGHLGTLFTGRKEDPTANMLIILRNAALDKKIAERGKSARRRAARPSGPPRQNSEIYFHHRHPPAGARRLLKEATRLTIPHEASRMQKHLPRRPSWRCPY